MDVFEYIKTRRSIRNYLEQPIDKTDIDIIIESAVWAPSAKNRQPWSFAVIQNKDLILKISKLSIYGRWMKNSSCFIIVFLNDYKKDTYIKDVQAIGASIQNILLTAHSLGIGACWIGEILEQENAIKEIIGLTRNNNEIMAIISLGYPEKNENISHRIPVSSKIILWK